MVSALQEALPRVLLIAWTKPLQGQCHIEPTSLSSRAHTFISQVAAPSAQHPT